MRIKTDRLAIEPLRTETNRAITDYLSQGVYEAESKNLRDRRNDEHTVLVMRKTTALRLMTVLFAAQLPFASFRVVEDNFLEPEAFQRHHDGKCALEELKGLFRAGYRDVFKKGQIEVYPFDGQKPSFLGDSITSLNIVGGHLVVRFERVAEFLDGKWVRTRKKILDVSLRPFGDANVIGGCITVSGGSGEKGAPGEIHIMPPGSCHVVSWKKIFPPTKD